MMLKLESSGRRLTNATPVDSGASAAKSVGCAGAAGAPLHAVRASKNEIVPRNFTFNYRPRLLGTGRSLIACPPPGARARRRCDARVTVRWEIVTGSGLVSQSAPGPSA